MPEEVGEATAHPRVDILPSLVHNRFVRESFRGNAMEPRIQYAKTTDGVSIAFRTLGEGKPLIFMPGPPPWSHVQMEWQSPSWRGLFEALAGKRKLVRYDNRGSGMSARDATDYSLGAHLLDLEAVAERLDLQSFSLMGYSHSVPIAISYAARHPERVSNLIIWSGYARASDYRSLPRIQAMEALLDHDWELYTETVGQLWYGWGTAEPARWLAQYMRECVTHEVAKAIFRGMEAFDVAALLPQVRAPTLVLLGRQDPVSSMNISRELASTIPDARLVVLEGAFPADVEEDVGRAINEFLGEVEEAPARALAKEDVHTILFTDIESSTALTQRLGDAKAQDLLRTHNTIVRDALKGCGGSEVKHTGDGIMASFPSASRALECAVAIQQAIAALADTPLRVRIGLNAGEPVAEEQDLFGTAVQLARRVCDHADPGQILASDVVRQLAMGKGFLFSDHRDVELRGFEDPVRLYEVRWREEAGGA